MKYGLIYRMACSATYRSYVGQSRDLPNRQSKHFSDARKGFGYSIAHAIRKYGEKAFTIEILAEWDNISDDDLNTNEVAYIAKYNTYHNGYNETLGGGGSSGWKWTEETRRRYSESSSGEHHWNYGKKHSLETRQKISKSLKGRQLPKETRLKIGKTFKGLRIGDKHPLYRHELDTKEMYKCYLETKNYNEVARRFGCSGNTVRRRIKKHLKNIPIQLELDL